MALEQGAIQGRQGLQLALQPAPLRLGGALRDLFAGMAEGPAGFWGGNLIQEAWALTTGLVAPR